VEHQLLLSSPSPCHSYVDANAVSVLLTPNRPPPKKKGNPIITRYPPPPGYRGPAQPQPRYGTNSFQGQNHSNTPHQYPPPFSGPPSSYQNLTYSAPQSYPPSQGFPHQGRDPAHSFSPNQSFPQQTYQHTQQSYTPAQAYSQPLGHHSDPGYTHPSTVYNGYPSYPSTVDSHHVQQSSNEVWEQSNGAQYAAAGRIQPLPTRDPDPTPVSISALATNSNIVPTSAHPNSVDTDGEKPQLFLAWDDWDFDFDGAIWPKSNEPVDPNLSLGVILWRPAKQVTRALASTYDDAEEQALKPPPEKLGNGESVSIYFTCENSHEAYLDVRQTDEWYRIRKDPIFVVFPRPEDMDLIPIEECLDKRDRPDWPLANFPVDEDEDMEDSGWNVMDNLEQALSGHDVDARPQSLLSDKPTHRTQKQEDVLAMLGVTGSPKPPSEEIVPMTLALESETKPRISLPEKPTVRPMPPVPARTEPPLAPQRAHSYGGHRNSTYGPPPQRPYGSMSSSSHSYPPPPPPIERNWSSGNPHGQLNDYGSDRAQASPTMSEASNRTLAGSDFEANVNAGKRLEATPKPHRSDNSFVRKRSYDDADQDEKLRQPDDHTRRKRRQAEVAAAYR
jgi:hypothetical protein